LNSIVSTVRKKKIQLKLVQNSPGGVVLDQFRLNFREIFPPPLHPLLHPDDSTSQRGRASTASSNSPDGARKKTIQSKLVQNSPPAGLFWQFRLNFRGEIPSRRPPPRPRQHGPAQSSWAPVRFPASSTRRGARIACGAVPCGRRKFNRNWSKTAPLGLFWTSFDGIFG
jgi:hypothetical protein